MSEREHHPNVVPNEPAVKVCEPQELLQAFGCGPFSGCVPLSNRLDLVLLNLYFASMNYVGEEGDGRDMKFTFLMFDKEFVL